MVVSQPSVRARLPSQEFRAASRRVRKSRTPPDTPKRICPKISPHPKSAICKPLEPGGERFADFLDGRHILEQIHTYQFLDGEISISGGGEQVGNEFSLLLGSGVALLDDGAQSA